MPSSLSLYGLDSPRRWPLAAGALGPYDAGTLGRLAAAVSPDLVEVQADADSALHLDRAPLAWSAGDERGYGWSEGIFARRAPSSWTDAARSQGACGLVVSGRRRFVHSSAAGALPLYYLERDGAVYFASRIEALAEVAGELSADWDAWAGIFTVGFAIGDRTPFSEIRRLRPYSRLEVRRGRAAVHRETWPWAEVEPTRSLAEGRDAVLEAMRDAAAAMAERPLLVALSGGWDSRLILCLVLEQGAADARAFTVNNDTGFDREERLAAEVARELGVPHEVVRGRPEDYWGDLAERYRRSEYQRPSNAWHVTLARRLGTESGAVTDGLGLGALMGAASKLITRDVVESGDGRAVMRALWRTHAKDGISKGLAPELRRELAQSARAQFKAETEWLQGHPSQPILTRYWTSTVRGFTLAPATAFGLQVPTATPFITDDVAAAMLSIQHREKFDGELYRWLLETVNSRAAALPSTHDTGPGQKSQADRRLAASGQYERILREGPLRDSLSPNVERRLDEGGIEELLTRGRSHWRLAVIVMFSLWHERYGDHLGSGGRVPRLQRKRRLAAGAATLTAALRRPATGESEPAEFGRRDPR